MIQSGPDLWALLGQMLRCRRFEELVQELWDVGAISGEMHLGLGEEAIIAGVGAHLVAGDALALDHRGTAALLERGVDPAALLAELLGSPDGLCRGCGGHMHLFAPEHLAASSGIVGAAGPAAAGFALAAQYLRPERLAVGYFGDGAMNQGMLLESLNLAATWSLPAIFVCKDNGWAITTPRDMVTGGSLPDRARAFGMPSHSVDGAEVEEIWEAMRRAAIRARKGDGPSFIHARCTHLEGHFLGDPLLRLERHPLDQGKTMAGPLVRAAMALRGGTIRERAASAASTTSLLQEHAADHGRRARDPVQELLLKLKARDPDRVAALEAGARSEMGGVRAHATNGRMA